MSFEIIEEGELEGLKYRIVSGRSGSYKGYLTFPERPLKELGYWGIAAYVSVHGGITFAEQEENSFTYGFDTAHCDSNEYPITDIEWIKSQLLAMKHGLEKAKELEDEYLLAEGDNKKRAVICQQVIDAGDKNQSRNFGININMLSGKL